MYKLSMLCFFTFAFTVANATEKTIKETFVVCENVKLENNTVVTRCDLIEASSLKSIDNWIAT